MSWNFKDLHLGLLQGKPSREAVPFPLRGPASGERGAPGRKAALRSRAGSRLGILLALLALQIPFWVPGDTDGWLARLGYRGVTALPDPSAALSLDDQARYWTFALYDFAALGERFQVSGYYAIDGDRARRRLDTLLPHVSPSAIGEISAYTSIAYHAVPRPRVRP